MKTLTARQLLRNPVGGTIAEAGTVGSIEAGAGKTERIEAANVVGFQQNPGKLEWVQANEHFTVKAGVHVLAGDFAEVPQDVARMLVANGRAEIVDEAEVQTAQKSSAPAKATAK